MRLPGDRCRVLWMSRPPSVAGPPPLAHPAMKQALLLLALGVALGYTLGYNDARAHDRTVVERLLDRAGGSARGKYDADVDRQAAALDER